MASVDWSDINVERRTYEPGAVIFAQGGPCSAVMYIEDGAVRLSLLSHSGKEAVVGILDRGRFFGEGLLIGQSDRSTTATAMSPCSILAVPRNEMLRALQHEPAFAAAFLAHMIRRNIRIEEDLADQLFNSTEKRLARALLLLAQVGERVSARRTVPRVSQELLAEMVGTTRTRVNFFMNKFRRLGLIEYGAELKVNHSLVRVVSPD
jgi:CRP-like cAMP-binding protein